MKNLGAELAKMGFDVYLLSENQNSEGYLLPETVVELDEYTNLQSVRFGSQGYSEIPQFGPSHLPDRIRAFLSKIKTFITEEDSRRGTRSKVLLPAFEGAGTFLEISTSRFIFKPFPQRLLKGPI